MPDSSMPFGGPQEPSQSSHENDSPIHVSVATLPEDLNPHGNVGVQQHHPNFFLLASSSHTQATSIQADETTSQGNRHNGEETQVTITAQDILAHPETASRPSAAQEVSSDARPASADENNGKRSAPDEMPHTSASSLLETARRMVKAIPVKANVSRWLEMVIIVLGLAVTFASHAINMFYYPNYDLDEGTYMMSAWSITHGQIEPYAYGYGHPPLAWIQIAAWVKLTGGFFTFGNAINSGRVLMLLFALGSAWLIHRIAHHLQLNFTACLFAMFVFALSPLAITFQREVLLDNFAVFWFLLALYLILVGKSRLVYTILAAICFGFSLLSKEVMIVLFPVMIYMVWLYTARFQRTFLLVSFCSTVIAVASTFVLMAALKGELFPYEWHLPWDTHPHLSLIGTYLSQSVRGQNEGSIHDSWTAWVTGDPLLIFLGVATPIFNLILGWWNRKQLFLALFAISFWALLLRGGVIFPFYILPLIPLIALNTAIALNTIMRWIGRGARFEQLCAILTLAPLMVNLIYYDIQQSPSHENIFTLRPTVVQSEALSWIRTYVPRRAVMIINNVLYTDLHEPQGDGVGDGAIYPYAEGYWNAALDPAIHDALLESNWDRIDYIILDPEMLYQIQQGEDGMNMLKTALAHSTLRVEFKGDNTFTQIYQVIHQSPSPNI